MWLFSFALTKKYGTLNWEEQMLFFVIVNGTIQQFQCEKKKLHIPVSCKQQQHLHNSIKHLDK